MECINFYCGCCLQHCQTLSEYPSAGRYSTSVQGYLKCAGTDDVNIVANLYQITYNFTFLLLRTLFIIIINLTDLDIGEVCLALNRFVRQYFINGLFYYYVVIVSPCLLISWPVFCELNVNFIVLL